MFHNAYKFNQPIGSWDTSKVESMAYMFSGAIRFNQPIGGWDTSQVRDMNKMFFCAYKFNQPMCGWDTSQVRYMNNMFTRAKSFNQSIDSWNTSQVTTMYGMFERSGIRIPVEWHPESKEIALQNRLKHEYGALLRFRLAHRAHRDARMCTRAAAWGHPLELDRRLTMGHKVDGIERAKQALDENRSELGAGMVQELTDIIESYA